MELNRSDYSTSAFLTALLKSSGESELRDTVNDGYSTSTVCVQVNGVLVPIQDIPESELVRGSVVLVPNPANVENLPDSPLSCLEIDDARGDIDRLRNLTYSRAFALGGAKCRCCEAVVRIGGKLAVIDHYSSVPAFTIRAQARTEPLSPNQAGRQLATG